MDHDLTNVRRWALHAHSSERQRLSVGVLAILVVLVVTGCMGSDVSPYANGLLEIDPDTAPLEQVAEEAWEAAPAGCEDRLGSNVSFKIASANDELVAAIDERGEIVCVDSLDSVQTELEEDGRDEEADELGARFLVTVVQLPDPSGFLDDPAPQPSHQMGVEPPGGGGIDGSDPAPQPS